jgi:hypothetical protein
LHLDVVELREEDRRIGAQAAIQPFTLEADFPGVAISVDKSAGCRVR